MLLKKVIQRTLQQKLINMSVQITDRAKAQLLDSLKEENKSTDSHHLRVGVLSGGCSGLQYFMEFGEKSDNQLEMYMSDLCTIPANLVGMPAISIPTGLSSQGLPLSVQIMSPSNTDNTLLDFSESLESLVAFTEEPVINGVVS